MRTFSALLASLVLSTAVPAGASWGYYAGSELRPDRNGRHPRRHLQVLSLPEVEPGRGCFYVKYQAFRDEGRRGSFTLVATVRRPDPRTGRSRRVAQITLGPVRLEEDGGSYVGRLHRRAGAFEPGDVVEMRWRFSRMPRVRSGLFGTIFLDTAVTSLDGTCT